MEREGNNTEENGKEPRMDGHEVSRVPRHLFTFLHHNYRSSNNVENHSF